MSEPLLQVEDLQKYYPSPGGPVRAVEDVSFSILRGETLGLVGESGCGKTTLGRVLLRLYEPTRGRISLDGTVLYDSSLPVQPDLRVFRRNMQMVFQDPASSLDPRMTVGQTIGQALEIHKLARTRAQRHEAVSDLLELVGLRPDQEGSYPHQLSGGMQQRVGIARALAVKPEFLVCDEPVSALDVSIQAQILNVLEEMQEKLGLTYLFIGHDVSVVRHISRRIGVMYLGCILELAPSEELILHPAHPYTRALLASVPSLQRKGGRAETLSRGDLPSPAHPPSGCRFRTRCPFAENQCAQCRPALREVAPGHFTACHLA